MTRLIRGAFIALIGVLATGAVAWAHADLQRSTPSADATLGAAPSEVSLWFSERLELAFSSIAVTNAGGQRMDREDERIGDDDPGQLTVSLIPLGPGVYTVTWQVLSVDSHRISGEFSFTVQP